MIIISKARLYRNIFPYKFLNKEGKKELKKIGKIILSALKKSGLTKNTEILKALVDREKELKLKQILSDDDRIIDESVIIKKSSDEIYTMINISEHLLLLSIKSGFNLDDAYKDLVDIEKKLSKHIIFSYSRDFGFIGINPFRSPHQLEFEIIMHLPAIYSSNIIDKIDQDIPGNNDITGINGDLSTSYGFIKIIYRPKNDEKITDFVDRVKLITMALEEREKQTSEIYISADKISFEDKVMRSYGILKYSKKLSYNEYLSLISNLLWGIYSKVIDMDSDNIIKNLFSLESTLKKNEKTDLMRAMSVKKIIEGG
jgi:protein arginine kinase